MLTLTQATRLRANAGAKLPNVWQAMAAVPVHLRRGQVHMLAAAPGVGKSTISLNYALRSWVPTLYLAPDGDARTTTIRAAASLTGSIQADVETAMPMPPAMPAAWVTTVLDTVNHVRWAFPDSPDVEELEQRIFAYAEGEGQWPELVVVDNLADVAYDSEDYKELSAVIRECRTIARRTQAAFLLLHHVTGQYEDGRETIPLSGIKGKVSKQADVVLTATRTALGDALRIAVVKNRLGKADPSGIGVSFTLGCSLERMQIHDTRSPL